MNTYHYIVLAMFVGFALLDHFGRGHRLAPVRYWRTMGAVSTLTYFVIATYAPFMWDAWLGEHRLFPAENLPFWLQVAGGFLVFELGIYVWHRTMHSIDWLWRMTHQMHHSAERVDIWGAFWFHPVDSLGWSLLGSLCLVLIVGVSPEAAFVIAVIATIPGMFQHTNIRTPRWLGYIIQRPESHSIHHQRGVHAFNYGDIPIFDILFGTFRNPAEWQDEAGFHEGSSHELAAMLAFKKIS